MRFKFFSEGAILMADSRIVSFASYKISIIGQGLSQQLEKLLTR
jgi:hypothetical protein